MRTRKFLFQFRSTKRLVIGALRQGWYRTVRIPAGHIAWFLWSHTNVDDRILSRKNGVRTLQSLSLAEVPPSSIKRFVQDKDVQRKFMIWHGDWDLRAQPIQEHYRYKLMSDLWQHRDQLESSNTYREMVQKIEKNQPVARINKGLLMDTPEKVKDYLEGQIRIFHSLNTEGFRAELAEDELNVAITRDGQLVKANAGRKRLIAAQILDMDSIPVRIAYVHSHWLHRHRRPGESRARALQRAILEAQHQASQEC